MKCEFKGCKAHSTQADTYLNVWLCDNHFSYIGRLTDDYQATIIDWRKIEDLTE